MHEHFTRRQFLASAATTAAAGSHPRLMAEEQGSSKAFRAGAYAIDITPQKLPVIVNGGFTERTANQVADPLHARCLVLDDGTVRLAIVVVDSCVLPQSVVDQAKRLASQATGIPEERMLVSATHTHSAPAVVGALGSRADEAYAQYLPGRIAEGIQRAAANLAAARIGWTTIDASEATACRRWITRPDRMGTDPFGERTVRAMMHPGFQNPDYIGPAGPEDPELAILSVQSPGGRPIALLANYSMHYHGAPALSADYYGVFAREIQRLLGADGVEPPFVGIMSQGTSGDLHNRDYDLPKMRWSGLLHYAQAVANKTHAACQTIRYHDWVSLAVAQSQMTLSRRVPDAERLAWAKNVAAGMGDRLPASKPEVYALEAIYLHQDPERTFTLQVMRIGELAITAFPCEVFGITGLKVKAQSPLETTFNVELANGYEGYIPPPEQHTLGGYTTWPARSAALEEGAEPKIVETMLRLLEQVSGKPRRKIDVPNGPYPQAVLGAKPAAYWRLNEIQGPIAKDASGNHRDGRYEDGVVFYLDGPASEGLCGPGATSRCAHFAGGRMVAALEELGPSYSVELWFWNGLPSDARPVTGYLFSRAAGGDGSVRADCLAIAGSGSQPGRLMLLAGDQSHDTLCGGPEIPLRVWHHVVLVRDGHQAIIYLNGKRVVEGATNTAARPDAPRLFIGGRHDKTETFEGKIAEVALYARPLSAAEVAGHFAKSGHPA